MARTFLTATREALPRVFPEKPRGAFPPARHLRAVDAREPWRGAASDRIVVELAWMAETERAILVYSIPHDCHVWVPRWLWPRAGGPEMAGEVAPVALPRYFVARAGLA